MLRFVILAERELPLHGRQADKRMTKSRMRHENCCVVFEHALFNELTERVKRSGKASVEHHNIALLPMLCYLWYPLRVLVLS